MLLQGTQHSLVITFTTSAALILVVFSRVWLSSMCQGVTTTWHSSILLSLDMPPDRLHLGWPSARTLLTSLEQTHSRAGLPQTCGRAVILKAAKLNHIHRCPYVPWTLSLNVSVMPDDSVLDVCATGGFSSSQHAAC